MVTPEDGTGLSNVPQEAYEKSLLTSPEQIHAKLKETQKQYQELLLELYDMAVPQELISKLNNINGHLYALASHLLMFCEN